jgi:N-acetylmuramoyl-L-alanine amidase
VPAPVTGGVRVLVIDPGHGGADAGVTGPSGVQEKTLTLDIARRIKTLVETRIAMRVLLTREDDRDMTLDARAALANNARADLFISLHLNASLSPMASGAEVYQFASDQDGANRPGASQALTLPTAAGGSRTVTLVPWNLAQLRHHDASTLLSNLLESSLRAHVPMSIRPTQEARLRLLAGLDMAAASIELAYLTNPAQDMAAQGEDFQNQAAQAIVEAVMAYRAAWRGDR